MFPGLELNVELACHKQSYACCLLRAGFLLCLFFDPEDGGVISPETLVDIHRTIGLISHKAELFTDHTVGSKGEKQEDGRNCIMRSLTMYTLHQMLLR
jgi:hypothetical protein